MKTAIIILNYNDSNNTIKYVNSIKNYNIINKIIIVDNFSTDNSLEKLQELKNEKIDIVSSKKNGGYSYGNNYGVKYLENKYKETYDYIIISNPDIDVQEEAIIKTIEFLDKNKKVAVASPRMNYNAKVARRSSWKKRTYVRDVANSTRLTELLMFPVFKGGEYSKKDFEQKELKVDCIAGAFFIIKYNVLKEINYFDENIFLFYEEDILGEKIKEKGYEIYSLNDIKYIHYDNQTIKQIFNNKSKKKMFNESRKYYHKTYNKVGKVKLAMLDVLLFFRQIEITIFRR